MSTQLKQRVITAIILIPIVISLLFFLQPKAFAFLTALLILACAWEWTNLMNVKKVVWKLFYLFLMIAAFIAALYLPSMIILFCAFLGWVIALILVILYPRGKNWWARGFFWRGVMGFFVLVPSWVAINYIRNQSDGILALLFLFVLIWGADSAAYFTGKKWGKNKLAPRVSPGKSLQGFIGEISFAVIFLLLVLWFLHAPLSIWIWGILLGVVTVTFSVVGDLFESMLKREVGLKDSGNLLPGHGGLLDRLDSLTAAAPVFALFATILSTGI